MKIQSLPAALLFAMFACAGAGTAQDAATPQSGQPAARPAVHGHRPINQGAAPSNAALCAPCVKDNLSYLAGPALHGRGSGTEDEQHAAEYIAAKLKSYGLAPAAADGEFIQVGTLRSREVVGNPTLTVDAKADGGAPPLVLTHGKQIVIDGLSQMPVSAALQKLDLNDEKASPNEVAAGAALLVKLKAGATMEEVWRALEPYRNGKAALVIVATSPASQRMFDWLAKHPPEMPRQFGDEVPRASATLVLAKPETFAQVWGEPDGTNLTLQAEIMPWKTSHTWNVLAKIEGASEKDQVILLSAHLDHLGVVKGQTYYGADDDASGTAAVMELARVLGALPTPKRTIIVALWGSEELGMVGASYFLKNPTFPLKDIVANLEFEMIGRSDPKVMPSQIWLTGWERTNLGPKLAQHGANLVGDPHPSEKFFTRSDNYALAQKGIVAQTVSSYGMHPDYHQPTDTVNKINFQHMDSAIASMIVPVTWLANSDFTPEWLPGKQPSVK